MNRDDALARLADLPALMGPDLRTAWAEPNSTETIALVDSHRIRRRAALETYFEWVASKGGMAFFLADLDTTEDGRPQHFIFSTEPHDPAAWDPAPMAFHPQGTTILAPVSEALKAEIAALPMIPNDRKVTDLLKVPDLVRFSTHLGNQTCPVGFDDKGGRIATQFSMLPDRAYVAFPNPHYDIARIARNPDYASLDIDDEDVRWSLPVGWRLCAHPTPA